MTYDGSAVIANVTQLAEIFGVTDRTVQLWVEDGMPRIEHGQYDLVACVRWKMKQLNDELALVKLSGDEKLHALRMEGQLISNREKELRLRKSLRELVDYEAVRIAWANELKTFSKSLRAMVPKLISALALVNNDNEKRRAIEDQINDVLSMLANDLIIEFEDTTAGEDDD